MKPEDKIFNAYFKAKNSNLYFNEIKELSKLSDSSLTNSLKKLLEKKILIQNKTKSNTFYKIKNKKLFTLKFSEIAYNKFQNLNIGVKIPLKNFIKKIPQDIITVILFGSAANKQEQINSDLDLLIVSNKKFKLEQIRKEINAVSNYPLSTFICTYDNFIKNEDHIIKQARKKGIPIFHEQIFYEVIINEY
jgi:predicted nucleotidyltransferase